MKFWTAHLRPGSGPVLVREGFSWGALLFGPLWLLSHRAWLPALLAFVLWLLVLALTTGGLQAALVATVAVAQGVFGRDLVRWSLERRGFTLAHVVAGADPEAALGRLLQVRPDLARPVATEAGLA